MKLIVAVDKNWAIGNKGELLVRIPSDQKNFRKITEGNTVILGRKTMDTFPGGNPLKNRKNIILSRNESYEVSGAVVVHSVENLLSLLEKEEREVYVIGGDSVYKELLPYCTEAYVTMIDHTYEADRYFPNLDDNPEWKMIEESEEQTYFDLIYYFRKYERQA